MINKKLIQEDLDRFNSILNYGKKLNEDTTDTVDKISQNELQHMFKDFRWYRGDLTGEEKKIKDKIELRSTSSSYDGLNQIEWPNGVTGTVEYKGKKIGDWVSDGPGIWFNFTQDIKSKAHELYPQDNDFILRKNRLVGGWLTDSALRIQWRPNHSSGRNNEAGEMILNNFSKAKESMITQAFVDAITKKLI